jgi:glucokinase
MAMATAPNIAAGVDLGGTKIQTVLYRAGKVIGKSRALTPQGSAEDVVEAVRVTLVSSAQEAQVLQKDVASVGIGFPGTVEGPQGRVIRAVNLPAFEGYALGAGLSKLVNGARVRIDNDVRVAVVGEQRAGAGRPFQNFAGVFVGTGVGGGLIIDGKLRHGRGSAGEIGHIVVKDGGRRCGCGNRGCMEAYAGRLSMERTALRWVKKDKKKTVLFDLMKRKGRDHLASGIISDALAVNDKVTVKLIDDAVWALGVGLASVQNLLDLEAFVIGGGLGERLGQPFIDRIAKAMKPHLLRRDDPPRLLQSQLGDLAGAVGAAIIGTEKR